MDQLRRLQERVSFPDTKELVNNWLQKTINIRENEHESLKPGENTRILILDDCADIQNVLDVLEHDKFNEFLKGSHYCFVLIANFFRPSNENLEEFQERFKAPTKVFLDRPLILQLNLSKPNSKTIFFKSSHDDELKRFDIDRKKIAGEVLRDVAPSINFNFRLLLSLFYFNFEADFQDAFLRCKVGFEAKFDQKRLIDYAVDYDDSLPVLFLKLSQPEENDAVAIRNAVTNGSLTTLRALLGLPIVDDGKYIKLSWALSQALKQKGEEESLLSIAAKSGKPEIVEFLIRLDIFDYTQEITARALTAGKLENLCVLLENNFPFPADSPPKETSERLSKLYTDRDKFHEAIEKENEEDVKKFIAENPKISIGYSKDNKSALRVALDGNKTKIYALLWYNRFEFSLEESKELTTEQQKQITQESVTYYGRHVDSYIFFIFSKTRLGLTYDKEQQVKYFDKIKDFLDTLNLIEEVVPLLKVIEHSYSLSIVFDFDNNNVQKIDLTQSSSSLGVTYPASGRIYIAAGKNISNADVLGTLAHELAHYAMKIAFDNAALPFRAGDSERENEFKEIVAECQGRGANNISCIAEVFTKYEAKDHCCELIVRIPEVHAHYLGPRKLEKEFSKDFEKAQREKLDKALENYEALKKFYFDHVDAFIKGFTKDPARFHAIRDVQQLNDRLGNLREFSSHKIRLVDETGSDDDGDGKQLPSIESDRKKFQLLSSEIPKYTTSNLIRRLKKAIAEAKDPWKDQIILLSSKDFRNESIIQCVSAACTLIDQITLIVNCDDGEEFSGNSKNLFKHPNSPKRVYIVYEEGSAQHLVEMDFPSYEIKKWDLKYKWDDLEEKTKSELLQTEVKFQGYDILLGKIVSRNSGASKKLPLRHLVKGAFKNIGKHIKPNTGYDPNYFIERSLHKKSSEVIDFESFLRQTRDEKLVLISDDAGMGKSTLLTLIAMKSKQQFTNHWVVHVDLHEHVETLRMKSFVNVVDLLVERFEGTEFGFEKTLLTQMFNESKVILLLDGLDEIAPIYFERFSGILQQLMTSSVKQIWVTLRPYLERPLKEKFGGDAWGIKPFNPENQKEFLVKYLKHKLTENELTELTNVDMKLQQCAEQLLNRVSRPIDEDTSDLTGIPLQARMLAEIFLDDVRKNLSADTINFENFDFPEHFDLLWLYQEFMTKKIEVVYWESGQVVRKMKASREAKREDIWREHEKLAIMHLLPVESFTEDSEVEADTNLMKLDKRYFRVRMSDTDLQVFGILSIDSHGKLHFIHRTYSEYFLASLVVQLITSELFEISPVKAREVIRLLAYLASATYQTTIDFIECALKKYHKELDNYGEEARKKVMIEVANQFGVIKNFDFLQHYVKSEIFLTYFLLSCVQFCSKEKIEEILWHGPPTLLWLACGSGIKCTIRHVLHLANGNLSRSKVKEYYTSASEGNKSPFVVLFLKLFLSHADLMNECLTLEQLRTQSFKDFEDKGLTYEEYKKSSIITLMFETAKEFLNTEKEKKLLFDELMKELVVAEKEELVGDVVKKRAPSDVAFSRKYFRYMLDIKFDILDELRVTEINAGELSDFVNYIIHQTREYYEYEVMEWFKEKLRSRLHGFAFDN